MAFDVSTGSTAIEFGATLRIGYRVNGSSGPFTYLTPLPSYNDLPYTFSVPGVGVWEIEYTQICPSCSGSNYSEPQTAIVTITS
jgi:hypothetical protein